MADPGADLGALTVERSAPDAPKLHYPRRWGSRALLPLALVGGFAALALWAAWDTLVPPQPVTVTPVRVQTGTVEVVGQELFRANGWVEPLPRAVDVSVQTVGMYAVRDIVVNPGDRVGAGKPLMTLDNTRADLDLVAVRAKHATLLATAEAAAADVKKADAALLVAEEAVKLAKAEGEADVNTAAAELARAEAGVRSADFAVRVEEDLWQSKAVTSDVKLRQARQAAEVARADRDAYAARHAKAKTAATVRAKQAELAVTTATADRASLAAKATGAAREAEAAKAEVRKAEYEFEQTKVLAPIDGIVMGLSVRRGMIVGGRDSHPEIQGIVATMYDPTQLQVRVEVPVAKFALVRRGAPAEIEVEDVLPGKRLAGVVLYDTHQANVARNSVPVRVSLTGAPPPELRPEMIASVRFLAPPSDGKPKSETARRYVIPRRLLLTDGDHPRVWVVDPTNGRAAIRAVELAPGEKDRQTELVALTSGLNPTDKLIATGREALKPGSRIKVTGEER
jgi:HlyD family secretion protein